MIIMVKPHQETSKQGESMTTDNDTREYIAVINHEEQYSIWPADREIPLGWRGAGKQGSKQQCLDFIEEVWTDMRPLSLKKQMSEGSTAL